MIPASGIMRTIAGNFLLQAYSNYHILFNENKNFYYETFSKLFFKGIFCLLGRVAFNGTIKIMLTRHSSPAAVLAAGPLNS